MQSHRILHTIRQGHIGGGETHIQELVRHLNRNKYESFVLAFGEGDMHEKLRHLGVPSFTIPTSRPFDVRIKKQVRKLAEEIRPSLIHAHGARACSNSYYLSKDRQIPLVYTVHGWTFRDSMNFIHRLFRRYSESFLVNRADLVINVSYSDYLMGRERLGITHSMEIVNGVDPRIFNGAGDHDQKYQFGFHKDDFVVCMIARITEQKDPITFIRAMDHLKDEKNIKALIVGDGRMLQDVKVLTHKLRLDDKIVFTGSRKDINQILSWTDVYCLPSLWEGMPIGILEAMSSGCAVIATNIMGTKEVVNEDNGILIDPGDYKGLAKGIMLLCRKPDFKAYIEANAKNHIRKYYSVKRMVNRVAGQYSQLLKRPKKVKK